MNRFAFVCCAIVCGALAGFAASHDSNTNQPPRIFVEPFGVGTGVATNGVDFGAVSLGRDYMLSRLVRPGRPFVCTGNASNAEYRLGGIISNLRSHEKSFDGNTYGHGTKTTLWHLDVIVSLMRNDEILLKKTKTSEYEERRPISESQFDNNIFHTLMMAAIEMAADEVIDFFEGDGNAGASGPGCVSGGAAAPLPGMSDAAPVDSRLPLAILKPEAGNGVDDNEAMLLWDVLESAVRGGAFRLISRSDLARMQEEIGFTTSSDLVNLASRDRARIGKIKTVGKLLATSVGVIGETYTMSFKVFDASTAEIDVERSRMSSARSMDALLRLVPATLAEVLAAPPSGIVLLPVSAPASMPKSVAAAFDGELLGALMQAGVDVKQGEEGAVRIVPKVAVFSIRIVPAGADFVYRGTVSGTISVEGRDVAPMPFKMEDVELGREQGAAPSWLTQRHGEKLVSMALGNASLRTNLSALKGQK